jgi:phage portal protein BeeE
VPRRPTIRSHTRRRVYVRTDIPGALRVNDPAGFLSDRGPVDPHTAGESPFWWVGDDGLPMMRRRSVLPAVTRCVEVLAAPVLNTTWLRERASESPGGGGVSAGDPPLWMLDPQLLGSSPGDTMSLVPAARRMGGHAFWKTVLSHAILYGRAPIMLKMGGSGPIAGSLRILNPFSVRTDDDGRWEISSPLGDPIRTDFDGRLLESPQWRVVVVRGGPPPFDDDDSCGVLARSFDSLRVGVRIQGFVDRTFVSGVPSGVLQVATPNFSAADAEQLRARWMKQHMEGPQVAVINSQVDYTPTSLKPIDAEIGSVKQMYLTDVAHAFGLSASVLDTNTGSNTYANFVDRRRDTVDTNLAGVGQQFMDVLSSLLPYGQRMAVDWASFASETFSQMSQSVIAAVDKGILSVDEARERFGYPRTAASPTPADARPLELTSEVVA